jgi:hypothetical protein
MIILFYTLISLIIAWFGRKYRFGFWGYFFACLFFTPPVGAVMVIASIPLQKDD